MAVEKESILMRYGIVMVVVLFIIIAIVYKMMNIMFVEGKTWRAMGQKSTYENVPLEPTRGNIYACDGRLMASSLPQFQLYFDFKADGYVKTTKKLNAKDSLRKYVDNLSETLATVIGDKTKSEYRSRIMAGMKKKSRQFLISPKKVSYLNLKKIKEADFLKLPRGVSGFYTKAFFLRKKPFGSLATRTIGDIYSEKGKGGKNGLELQFDSVLRGTPGVATFQKVRQRFINITKVEPVDGMDIMSTIDVNIQDIAEKALVDKLTELDAASGTVVLMEVSTGEVKAITNMARLSEGIYGETRNQAVSDMIEPGSTFKVASMMVALDNGKVHPKDTVDTGCGIWSYAGKQVRDHNWDKGGYHRISAEQVIWNSSNVGTAKIIDRAFRSCPAKYVDGLYAIGLNKKLDFQIPGSGKPYIKYPTEKSWSRTTLAWMSFGYETQIPPMYILTFYNAIANNGVMVKPFLARSINQGGKIVKQFETEVVNPAICKPATLKIIQSMLEGVVKYGTGGAVKSKHISIAGKTGTAQVSEGGGYSGHQVSFCGYFPTDKPKYSAIVVIRYPRIGHASGGGMSGVVFKRIAEQVYARSLKLPVAEVAKDSVNPLLPDVKIGLTKEITSILNTLKIKAMKTGTNIGLVKSEIRDSAILMSAVANQNGIVPNVLGMGARDAVYQLENRGLRVILKGSGSVVAQQPYAGSPLVRGTIVRVELK